MKRRPALLAALGYATLSIPATWPLARRFSEGIAGYGDPWVWLWNFWWWRESLVTLGRSPFFTDRAYWPEGISLWLQPFDIPAAMLALPWWGVLPEVSIYNLMLWLTFPAAGLAFYFLALELWGGRLAAFLSGCLYTFSAYHFARASAHLHVSSIQWAPLYFLGLVRMLRGGGLPSALLAAAGLALATLASPYYLLHCAAGTAAIVAVWLTEPQTRRRLLSPEFFRLAAGLAGGFALLAGWYLLGMLRAGRLEPFEAPHVPEALSADLLNFFIPNPTSACASWFADFWGRWTCRGAEADAYVGYTALGLAVAGAVQVRAARPFLAAAGLGAVFALGPRLHIGGQVYDAVLLPYGWLLRWVPALAISGCPNKFSWLASFGVAAAAGAALAELCRGSRRRRAAACALAALALVEVWPRPLHIESFPAPPILREIGRDPRDFAVLDLSQPFRALWHAVLHRRPQPGGYEYAIRAPIRSARRLERDALLRPFLGPWPQVARQRVAFQRVDPAIELDEGPGEDAPGRWHQGQWVGSLEVRRAGDHRFFLSNDDYAALWIDGRPAIGGPDAAERDADVRLSSGPHAVRFLYRRGDGKGRVRLSWRPPGGRRAVIARDAFRTPDGRPGLAATYLRFTPDLGMSPAEARRGLEALRVRYVITDGNRRGLAAALGLPLAYRGDGLEIYELPQRLDAPTALRYP